MSLLTFGDNNKYTWKGWRGCWFSSQENGVVLGDVRLVEGTLFFAYTIHRFKFSRDCINWVPVDDKINDYDKIASFLKSVL